LEDEAALKRDAEPLVPAQAGTQRALGHVVWVPAFAGTSGKHYSALEIRIALRSIRATLAVVLRTRTPDCTALHPGYGCSGRTRELERNWGTDGFLHRCYGALQPPLREWYNPAPIRLQVGNYDVAK
jgi:hypothetical protein